MCRYKWSRCFGPQMFTDVDGYRCSENKRVTDFGDFRCLGPQLFTDTYGYRCFSPQMFSDVNVCRCLRLTDTYDTYGQNIYMPSEILVKLHLDIAKLTDQSLPYFRWLHFPFLSFGLVRHLDINLIQLGKEEWDINFTNDSFESSNKRIMSYYVDHFEILGWHLD